MIDLTEYLVSEHIFFDLEAKDKTSLLKIMGKQVCKIQGTKSSTTLVKKIQEREELESTGIGKGFAIPHCHLKNFEGVQVFMAVLTEPIDFSSIDGSQVRIVFMIISSDQNNEQYLKILSSLIYLIRQNDIRERLINAPNKETIISILASIKKEDELPYSELLKNLIELERLDFEIDTYEQEHALENSEFLSNNIKEDTLKRRDTLVQKIDRRLLGTYKNLKKRYGHGIIVKLKGNVCGGCNIKVPVHIMREIRRGMQIMTCESCARILYSPSLIKHTNNNKK